MAYNLYPGSITRCGPVAVYPVIYVLSKPLVSLPDGRKLVCGRDRAIPLLRGQIDF